MTEIRNSAGKLICRLDTNRLIVEVVRKGIRTTIYIVPGNNPIVANSSV